MAELRLSGLKILVTRPVDQAAHLAQAIEQAGGVPLLLPLLQILPAENAKALHQQVARLADFDLAIFISPNAVQYGMAAIRKALGSMPARTRVATIGMGSANALREQGVADVLVPSLRYDSEGLLDKLQQVEGLRVMILRGDGGRELLGDTLKARGAYVEYATCYRRSKPDLDADGLQNIHPDALTVTSSEALEYLWQIVKTCPEPCRRIRDLPLFVPHARIEELARKQGWTRVYLTGPGDQGLLAGLAEWANQGSDDSLQSSVD